MKIIAFAMYDGLVNVWLTTGNWKRSFVIKNDGAPAELKRTHHHSLRRKSGRFDAADMLEEDFAKKRLIEKQKEEFYLHDRMAINAISWLSRISAHHLWITAGMDGYVRLFDCLDGQMCGNS